MYLFHACAAKYFQTQKIALTSFIAGLFSGKQLLKHASCIHHFLRWHKPWAFLNIIQFWDICWVYRRYKLGFQIMVFQIYFSVCYTTGIDFRAFNGLLVITKTLENFLNYFIML